jgi:hypothetical protein
MTVPYVARLLCLSLACFFLVHTILAAMALAVAGRVIRAAERLRPRDGARLLFLLRVLPAILASVAVAGLCVPSFLWLEPSETYEKAGVACLVAALLGACVWIRALSRATRAVAQSRRYMRMWAQVAQPDSSVDGSAVWLVPAEAPFLALAGVIRPRVVISRGLMERLNAEQLRIALRHEEAHSWSRDNLKRLVLLLTPGVLPGGRAFGTLERAWARVTEWAADERASQGDAGQQLALAEALIRAVRIGCAGCPPGPLATTLLENPVDVGDRVKRLLEPPANVRPHGRYWVAAASFAAGTLAILLLQPGTLYSVHRWLEELMR